uniref:Uncharacterized protein n=1 Tax=Anguilla anguilla TaxID=7936 RepID=A0A0E9R4U6_ANGAN
MSFFLDHATQETFSLYFRPYPQVFTVDTN